MQRKNHSEEGGDGQENEARVQRASDVGCVVGMMGRLQKSVGVYGMRTGKRDAVLVVLPQVEMATEPRLDARVGAHDLDELAAVLTTVVQPAAAVDDVVFLEDTEPRAPG